MDWKAETKRKIEVMQAFCDGKAIEFRAKYGNTPHEWTGGMLSQYAWDWDGFEYRVKPDPPKPREWWVVPAFTYMFKDEAAALKFADGCRLPVGNPVHVKEVLDEW